MHTFLPECWKWSDAQQTTKTETKFTVRNI